MVKVFVAYRSDAGEWPERLRVALEAPRAGEEAVAVRLDRPDIDERTWKTEIFDELRGVEVALILVTAEAAGGVRPDPFLARAIAALQRMPCSLAPVVIDTVPGFLAEYSADFLSPRAEPKGGVSIRQAPYDLAPDRWMDDLRRAVLTLAARWREPDFGNVIVLGEAVRGASAKLLFSTKDRAATLADALPGRVSATLAAADNALDFNPRGLLPAAMRIARETADFAAEAGAAGIASAAGTLSEAIRAYLTALVDGETMAALASPDDFLDLSAAAGDFARLRAVLPTARAAVEALAAAARAEPPPFRDRLLSALDRLGRALAVAEVVILAPRDHPGSLFHRPSRRHLAALADELSPLAFWLRTQAGAAPDSRTLIDGEVAPALETAAHFLRRLAQDGGDPGLPPEPRVSLAFLPDRTYAPPLSPGARWFEPLRGLDAGWSRMVTLPPGAFVMGAPDGEAGSSPAERPRRRIVIDHIFALGEFPVTFAMWFAIMGEGYHARLDDRGWGQEDRPAIGVDFERTQYFIGFLNAKLGLDDPVHAYRLPTEAEWEYACRAGTTTPYGFGRTLAVDQANCDWGARARDLGDAPRDARAGGGTTPRGRYPANAFGLYDMHGSVWEWCEDFLHDDYAGAPADASAWVEADRRAAERPRVARGGSCADPPALARSAARAEAFDPEAPRIQGLRLARTLWRPEASARRP